MRQPLSRRTKILGAIALLTCQVVLVCAFVALVFYAADLSSRITAANSNNLANRVKNVDTWCHAINDTNSVLRAYVQAEHDQFKQIPVLTLPDLPCQRIAHRTQQSAH